MTTRFSPDELKHLSGILNIPLHQGDNSALRFSPLGKSLSDLSDAGILASYIKRPGGQDRLDLSGAVGIVNLDRAEPAMGGMEPLVEAVLDGRIPICEHYAAVCWFSEDGPLPKDHRTLNGKPWCVIASPPRAEDCEGHLPEGAVSVEFSADLPVWPTPGCHVIGDADRCHALERATEAARFSWQGTYVDPACDFWEPSPRPGQIQCRVGHGVFELPRNPELDRVIAEQGVYALVSGSKCVFPCRIASTSGREQATWPGVAREVLITMSTRGTVNHTAQVERPGRGSWQTTGTKFLTGVKNGHLWILSAE